MASDPEPNPAEAKGAAFTVAVRRRCDGDVIGTGFAIQGKVVTCVHVVADAVRPDLETKPNVGAVQEGDELEISFAFVDEGSWIPAKVVKLDQGADVALLECDMPEGVGNAIAYRESLAGDLRFECLGFGTSVGAIHRGKIVGYFGKRVQSEWIGGTRGVPGYSGGAIIAEGGELIGMMREWLGEDENRPDGNFFTPIAFVLGLLGAPRRSPEAPDLAPLYSELPGSVPVKRFLSNGLLVGGIVALLSIVAVALSRSNGAGCMQAIARAHGRVTPILFGYIAEPNHGIYQVFVASLFVALSLRFVDNFETFLVQFAQNGKLYFRSDDPKVVPEDAVTFIARTNRKVFRYGFAPVALAIAAVVFVGEYTSRPTDRLGWVQAERVQALNGRHPIQDFAPAAHLADLPAFEGHCANDEPCELELRGGVPPKSRASFEVFLVIALSAQALYLIVTAWVVVKNMMVLGLLWWALTVRQPPLGASGPTPMDRSLSNRLGRWLFGWLLRNPSRWLRLQLDFDDDKYRFGLRPLDPAYTNGMWLLLIAGVGTMLGFLSNLAKGSRFLAMHESDGSFHLDLLGQVILPILFAASGIVLPLLPGIILLRLAARQRDRLLEELASQEQRTPPGELKGKIAKRAQLVRDQKAWPSQSVLFWFQFVTLIFLAFLGAFLPLTIAGIGHPVFLVDWIQRAAGYVCQIRPES